MIEQFCGYEIAVKLKEKGFDEECFSNYDLSDEHKMLMLPFQNDSLEEFGYYFGKQKDMIKAPLWSQIIDWFRIKHNLDISIFSVLTYNLEPPVEWYVWFLNIGDETVDNNEIRANTYEVAREQAILKALTLI